MPEGTTAERLVKVHARAERDFYIEPGWCVDLLLQNERFIGDVWDPCAGSGTVVKACKRAGLTAIGTDMVTNDPLHVTGGINFMNVDRPFKGAGRPANIIFNPPYRDGQAQQFILRALSIATNKVAAVLQQQFPFSIERFPFFTAAAPVARIYYLSSRPSMPPGDPYLAGEIEAKGGSTDYLWMVWDHGQHPMIPTTAFWLKR